MASHLLLGLVVVVTCYCAIILADDPSPLQDFCVADNTSPVFVNGFACKDPKLVQANDFYSSGFHLVRNTSNPLGLAATRVSVTQIPGLNALGISMVRGDFAPWGVNPPHTHPRASETILVLEGTLEVGFITSNPENRLITKVIHKGDVFVFPKGLVHYNRNIGSGNAIAITFFNSQNPGTVVIARTLFNSVPSIPSDLLAKSFQVDEHVISSFWG